MARFKDRLILKQATIITLENSQIEARVILSMQDRKLVGIKQGIDGTESRQRLVVEATLAALEQSVASPVKFEVSGINIKEFGPQGHKFFVVLLKTDYFIAPVSEAIELLGACQISDYESEAEIAARATLDATNRAVSSMLGGR
ncbi:MAG: hypothetical protein HY819_15000 [Acidobacteria bacterium]|nr:hypothetical protein [Acidobacteriota bacterium]